MTTLAEKEKDNILNTKNLLKILDSLHTAIYIVNHKGDFIYINDAAARLEGVKKEDAIDMQLLDFYELTSFNTGLDSPTLDCAQNGTIHEEDNCEWYIRDGKAVNALISAYPFDENDLSHGVFSTADDISELRKRLYEVGTFEKKTSYRLNNKMLKNGTKYVFEDIVGQSTVMKDTVLMARRFASKQAPIMIYGETGTGKELFAQSIHNASPRVAEPFVPINCAAIPDTLLESILFGTVKGAFTGATDSPGLFEKANGGTIFLDEINSMPMVLQAKILRALQEKEVQRIGDTKIRKIDCRVVSATNKLPSAAIHDGELREDLFYRLATGLVYLPPLRERKGDLHLLIDFYIDRANAHMQTQIKGISEDFYQLLEEYNWPGNVRELQNTIESAVNLTAEDEHILDIQHLPEYLKKHFAEEIAKLDRPTMFSRITEPNLNMPTMDFDLDLATMVDDYEKSLIKLALSGARGNLTKCGEKLGLSRQALTHKIKKYQIDPNEFKK
ncbi:MAG: sigma 54-interacting transcriptional regulator [Firmicutes bacterium]|nr:sigma 54-interacting transcriptional regulator [Bacillota bacterium]MBQ6811306.1 sigma 54-interacting transcriptional regulator [Bacillota bacterium]